MLQSMGAFATIDPPGALQALAIGINDDGKIVGAYSDSFGIHGFVRTP
jgi:hypothetical protein